MIKTIATPGEELDSLFVDKMGLDLAGINNVMVTLSIPGRENEWQGRVKWEDSEGLLVIHKTRIDKDYFKTFGPPLEAGQALLVHRCLNRSAISE